MKIIYPLLSLNHLAFTVEDFEEAKKLIIKNGGSYTDKKSYRLIGGSKICTIL